MLRLLIFLLVVLGLGFLFAWVADNPGTIFLEWDWLAAQMGRPGEEVGIPLTLAIAHLVVLVFVIMEITGILRGILGTPAFLTKFFDNRRRERGYKALSRGLIAASSGDVDTARSLAKESGRLLGGDPLVALLGTQTALLEGKRDEARASFQTMLEDDSTRMVALRGLFLEAERQGEPQAARHYAEEAAKSAPSLPWAGKAKLRYQAVDGDWDASILTLDSNRSAGLIDKQEARHQRAILLTAKAMSLEQANPEGARKLAKEAHKLSKDLVPAATSYARSAARLGDIKGASKVLEETWRLMPHPEIADAYATVRPGDSVQDRLSRAKHLASIRSNSPEGNFAIANAAIDANEWDLARKVLEPVLTTRPTERACLLMADIEEGQNGDKGRMRDWLARAVRAPADPVWTADGHVSEEWLPVSPVSGEVGAFEWKVPVEQLGDESAPVLTLEELQEAAKPISTAEERPVVSVEDDPNIIDAEEVIDTKPSETSVEESKPEEASSDDVKEEVQEEAASTEEANSEEAKSEETVSEEADKGSENDKENDTSAEKEDFPESANDNPTRTAETDNSGEDTESQKSGVYENTAELPLKRRPDDPGPHPDKEPPKKGIFF